MAEGMASKGKSSRNLPFLVSRMALVNFWRNSNKFIARIFMIL
jgi:hypothetical protein